MSAFKITESDVMIPLLNPLGGYWWESQDTVCVPYISSQSPRILLAFLGNIERKGKLVFFPTVITGRFARLLERRGYQYHVAVVYSKEYGEWVDGYVKVVV